MKRISMGMSSLPKISWIDGVVAMFVIAILYVVVQLSSGMGVPFSAHSAPQIILHWWMLPYYAGRSLLRMFIAFFASIVFTFIYGRIAASYKVAERIMIPLLDILQSVPVLGFLSITVTGFMGLFPHRLLGVELASIFAIFTGQVWNMTFSFYSSISALPKELIEASKMNRFDGFTRFTRLELPYSMIGLVWNGMMSFGGGWFFLAASESISVLNQHIQLPGIGSYMATAMAKGDIPALIEAIITMILMIVIVDQLFWRPIVAWSQKFRLDMSNSDDQATSWFLQFLRRSKVAGWVSDGIFGSLFRTLDQWAIRMARKPEHKRQAIVGNRLLRLTFSAMIWTVLGLVTIYYGFRGIREIVLLGWPAIIHTVFLGFLTTVRVFASTALALIWTIPVGVAIGLNPKASRITQPLVQIASSFPANMLFPLITLLYLQLHVNFGVGSVLLMMLGTQWYILFNVIAGSMAIPNDLREAAKVLGLSGWNKWKNLLLPSIFPYVITGCITASGGAWNASIIAEIVSWKGKTLVAPGLGSLISQATTVGDWPSIVFSIIVMAAFVTIINRTIWRPLHRIAESRFRLIQ